MTGNITKHTSDTKVYVPCESLIYGNNNEVIINE